MNSNDSTNKLVDIIHEWLQAYDKDGPIYVDRIRKITPESPFLTVDGDDLRQSQVGVDLIGALGQDTTSYLKVISAFEMAVKKLAREFHSTSDIRVRFRGIEETRVSLMAVGARFYQKGVMVRGRVVSMSPKAPYAKRYVYKCTDPACKQHGYARTISVLREGEILKEPDRCSECKSKFIDIVESEIYDSQFVKIIESVPSPLPCSLQIWCVGADLCNKVQPGRVIDIFGMVDIDSKPTGRPVYRINANNIEHYESEFEDFELAESDIMRFSKSNPDAIVNQQGFWDKSWRSFAPEVLGMNEVKESLLMLSVSLNLVGNKQKPATADGLKGSTTINMLLAGSPAIAKSRCLKYTARVAPNSGFVSAATAREASLTVFAENDRDAGYFVITPGFLPRCNDGIACLDEFDKADKIVYTKLHEIGSDKTCSYAKGGHSGTLPANCAIVCACNSVFPYWNEKMDIQKNLAFMPPSMLTRFDLIFVILDRIDEEGDQAVAQKVFENNDELWWQNYMDDRGDIFGFRTMRKYITFVNTRVPFPKLPKTMEQYVTKRYVHKRKDETLLGLITPRYVNNIIRLAIAHARFLQKSDVEIEDLELAESLLEWSMKAAAFDPVTGKFDSNITDGMTPKSEVEQAKDDMNVFERSISQVRRVIGGTFVAQEAVKKLLVEQGWDEVRIKIAKTNVEKLNQNPKKASYFFTNENYVEGWRLNN